MKQPFPWYSDSRSGGGWFVKLNGEQHFLGNHPEDASQPPKQGRDGRWNPPAVILDEFYKLMTLRDTASDTGASVVAPGGARGAPGDLRPVRRCEVGRG